MTKYLPPPSRSVILANGILVNCPRCKRDAYKLRSQGDWHYWCDYCSVKPELVEQLVAGELLDVVLEAYADARARIAELEARTVRIKLPDPSSKAFWGSTGKGETFYPSTYKIWVKEAVERAGTIAQVAIEVK